MTDEHLPNMQIDQMTLTQATRHIASVMREVIPLEPERDTNLLIQRLKAKRLPATYDNILIAYADILEEFILKRTYSCSIGFRNNESVIDAIWRITERLPNLQNRVKRARLIKERSELLSIEPEIVVGSHDEVHTNSDAYSFGATGEESRDWTITVHDFAPNPNYALARERIREIDSQLKSLKGE